jgi:hypothetical protein
VVRLVLVIFVVACAPNYQADIDRTLARAPTEHREIAAPTALQLQPWKVGQWTLYRVTRNADVGYIEVSIMAQDTCGIWLHQITQSTEHRLDVRICYRSMPTDGKPDLVQIVKVKVDESETRTVDFHDFDTKAEELKKAVLAYTTSFPIDWHDNTALPREDLDLPAGHFAQAVRGTGTSVLPSGASDSTVWSHPDVPIGGTLKVSTDNGTELVLVAYGQSR